MWYTKREQSILTSLWYCMTGVQLMVRNTLQPWFNVQQANSSTC
jgi:hypothetical protein